MIDEQRFIFDEDATIALAMIVKGKDKSFLADPSPIPFDLICFKFPYDLFHDVLEGEVLRQEDRAGEGVLYISRYSRVDKGLSVGAQEGTNLMVNPICLFEGKKTDRNILKIIKKEQTRAKKTKVSLKDYMRWMQAGIDGAMYKIPIWGYSYEAELDFQINKITSNVESAVRGTYNSIKIFRACVALVNSKHSVNVTERSRSNYVKMDPVYRGNIENLVTLKDSRNPRDPETIREILSGPPKRLHDVRGHFAHSHKTGDSDCNHSWIHLTESRWKCSKCGMKRWWRAQHERGDERVGRVHKVYEVSE